MFISHYLIPTNMKGKVHSNKKHGHNMIRIRILKYVTSIGTSLEVMFRSCLIQGIFSYEWKKANVVPIHKKNEKQCITNYRLVFLFPICRKVCERIIYDTIFSYLLENNLISVNQSCFKPGGYCINQFSAVLIIFK